MNALFRGEYKVSSKDDASNKKLINIVYSGYCALQKDSCETGEALRKAEEILNHGGEEMTELARIIEEKYEMERLWNTGGKNWTYEYKYRRGGKTLCCLYAKSNCMGFMIIFGKDERTKFEAIRDTLSDAVCRQYDETKTYHDGKWLMFEPIDTTLFDDFMKLLGIKRKPNKK